MSNTNENIEYNISIKATIDSCDYADIYEKDEEGNSKKIYKDGEAVKDLTKVQISSMVFNKKTNKFDRSTLSLQKNLTEKQLDEMIGKTYVFSGVEQYNKITVNGKYKSLTTNYSATDLKESKSDKDIFEVNKSTVVELLHVSDVKGRDFNTKKDFNHALFQIKYRLGRKNLIKEITLNNAKSTLFKSFIGKKVKFSFLTESIKKGMLTLSTNVSPTLANPSQPQETK